MTFETSAQYLRRCVETDADDYHIDDLLADSIVLAGDRILGPFKVQPMRPQAYLRPSSECDWTLVPARAGTNAKRVFQITASGADFCGRMCFASRDDASLHAARLTAELKAMTPADWQRCDRDAEQRMAALDKAVAEMNNA